MSHLPRHLLLAAVFFTVCCADGQVPIPQDASPRQAVELAGQTAIVKAVARRQAVRRQQVRPAISASLPAKTAILRSQTCAGAAAIPMSRRPALTFDQMRIPPPTPTA